MYIYEMTARELYQAGIDWPDKDWTPKIVRELVSHRQAAGYIYLAGVNWPRKRLSRVLTNGLMIQGTPRLLYLAGLNWPDKLWSGAIAINLRERGDEKYLALALKNWPPERRKFLHAETPQTNETLEV